MGIGIFLDYNSSYWYWCPCGYTSCSPPCTRAPCSPIPTSIGDTASGDTNTLRYTYTGGCEYGYTGQGLEADRTWISYKVGIH